MKRAAHEAETHETPNHASEDGSEDSYKPDRLQFRRIRKIPLIRQAEATECGLACIAMISAYHGQAFDMPYLRRRFELSLKGMTLADVIDAAQALGLNGRPLKLELEELRKLSLPCILHWGFDHFVVLYKVTKHGIMICDPAFGYRFQTWKEAGKHFTGVALELRKGQRFARMTSRQGISLRALAGDVKGIWKSLAITFSLALTLELFALLSPLFLQMVVDQVLADGDHDLLSMLGMGFLLLLVFQVTISGLRTWTIMWVSAHFNLGWSGNIFAHLMRLPQAYFMKRHLGDVVSRFGAIGVIQQTLTTQFVDVILDGLMTILILAVMFIYSGWLAALCITAILIYSGLRLLYYQVYQESNLSQIIVSARQQSLFMESVRGVQTLRLFNKESAQTSRFLNAATDTVNTSIAIQKLNLMFGSVSSLTFGVQRILVLWVGAWLALKGQLSAGMLMAFAAYADQFASRSASLIDYAIQLRLLRQQTDRVADIVLTPREAHVEGIYAGPQPSPSIAFEGVSFRYSDNDAWILHNCSFQISAGEIAAITGASGCGKSTLVRLMMGLLEPQEGKISVGDVDLKHLGKARFRKMVGSVLQDDRLFSGTIAENIAFFDPDAKPVDVEEAASMAGIHEDILAMPMGYHSLVGDMGSVLSGGQQQRVLLARALFRKPSILVLDEATSHLDIQRESAINLALAGLSATRILISHRKETIAAATRVLAFEQGKVREAGTNKPNYSEFGSEDAEATYA